MTMGDCFSIDDFDKLKIGFLQPIAGQSHTKIAMGASGVSRTNLAQKVAYDSGNFGRSIWLAGAQKRELEARS